MAVTINGSAGVTTNSGAVYNGLQTGTAVASTSGTTIDFTGIPSWVKRITVMLNGVSTSGTSAFLIQLGDSGGIENTGYLSSGVNFSATALGGITSTSGLLLNQSSIAAATVQGVISINNLSNNIWTCSSSIAGTGAGAINSIGAGGKTLSDILTQVRITTVNGTDTFDAGSINIIYE